MNKYFKVTNFLFYTFWLFQGFTLVGQNDTLMLGGAVNKYSKVTLIDYNCNFVVVIEPSLFKVGSTVLLIQMQGAKINETNTELFGDLIDLQNAGSYEMAKIKYIINNKIYFTTPILRQYSIDGAVQLVSVPDHENIRIVNLVLGRTWDGNTGGVVVIKSKNLMILDADVSARSGFNGGSIGYFPTNVCNSTRYFGSISGIQDGEKGEGIAGWILGKHTSRGKNLNGGGGGNYHNSGGGGGGNGGAGGIGGKEWSGCFPPPINYGGIGGHPLSNIDANHLFIGGGGGGGNANDSQGSPGGAGGGIVILIFNELQSNNRSIRVNGWTPTIIARLDSSGGGGAGGTVVLYGNSITGTLNIDAKGGNGGQIVHHVFTESQQWGSGGGGGGGQILTNMQSLNPATYHLEGGQFGSIPVSGSWGAENGLPGILRLNVNFPFLEIDTLGEDHNIGFQLDSISDCEEENFQFSITANNNDKNLSFRLSGNGIDTISNSIFHNIKSGTYNVSVLDSNGCFLKDTSLLFLSPESVYLPAIIDVCANESVTLTATNGTTYLWSTGETTRSINVIPIGTHKYEVTITDDRGCAFSAVTTLKVVRQILRSWASSHSIFEGDSITIHALPRNATDCQWYKDFIPIPFANDSIYIATEEGFYEVEGTVCGKRTKSGLWKIFVNKKKAGDNFNGLMSNSTNTNSPDEFQFNPHNAENRGLICEVYPNPVLYNVQIKINEIGAFKIYDSRGVVWHSFNIQFPDKELITIDMSNWPPGVYYLEGNSNDSRFVEKIIKL